MRQAYKYTRYNLEIPGELLEHNENGNWEAE